MPSLPAQRFLRHAHTYESNAIVQRAMAQRLVEILRTDFPQCTEIFEFGCGRGSYTRLLQSLYPHAHFVCNDINDCAQYFGGDTEFLRFDMGLVGEALPPRSFSLITANAAIQWLNQRKCLQALPRFLRPHGALLLSSFGTRNLWQIRELCGVGLEYLNLEEYEEILSKDFEILHLSCSSHTLRFSSSIEVFRHLHASGVNGVQKGFFLSKALLKEYTQRFANALEYESVYLYARKKS